jgi:tetratricopeptide (TPR) repeat protein
MQLSLAPATTSVLCERRISFFRTPAFLDLGNCMQDTSPSDWDVWVARMVPHRARRPVLLFAVVIMFVPSYGRQTGPSSSPPTGGAPLRSSERTVSRLLEEVRGCCSTSQSSRIRIARVQAQAGDRAGARAALARELQAPENALSLLDIAQVQTYIGDRDAALSTLLKARQAGVAEVDPNGMSAYTLGRIATAQLRAGDATAGRDTFEQALRSARMVDGIRRAWAIETVILQEADAGELVAAMEAVASVDDLDERLNAISAMNVESRGIDREVAGRILRLIDVGWRAGVIRQAADERKGLVEHLRIDTLVGLALTEAAASRQQEAKSILQDAERIAEDLSVKSGRYYHLRQIAKALVKAGAASEASRIANTFGDTDRNIRFMVLCNIAEAHTEIGDRTAALKAWSNALQAARTGAKKLRALMGTASVQNASGDREGALRSLDQALIAAKSITDEDEDAEGAFLELNEIAKARAEAKDIGGAIRLANTIPNNQVAGDALASIAEMQAASGDVRGALDTAEMIKPPNMGMISHMADKGSALSLIIRVQAREGDVTGALATAERLGAHSDGKRFALLALADGLGQRRHEGNETGAARRRP